MENPVKQFLFRGVNAAMHECGEGLLPKGTTFLRELQYNGDFKHDGSLTYGQVERNAVIGHQFDSNKYPTSGISTSIHFDVAKSYATFGNKSGYVYVFDRTILEGTDIDEFIVHELMENPKKPQDDEVILRKKDDSPISTHMVSVIIPVTPEP